jgi:hypothetical protein
MIKLKTKFPKVLPTIILLVVLIVVGINEISAQNKFIIPQHQYGIKFGYQASMINFKPAVSQSYLLGNSFGVIYKFTAEKSLGLQAEVLYSQLGWNESNGLYARQLNYLEIPFMTQFYFGNKARFLFNIGPKIGFLLNEKVTINNTVNSTAEQHIQPIYNKFDYGFVGGFGGEFHIGKTALQLDTRAGFSMSDVFSNDKRDFFDLSNNMYVSASLAFLFRAGK